MHWNLHRMWHVITFYFAWVDDGNFGRATFWRRFGLGHQNTCASIVNNKCVQCWQNHLCHSKPNWGIPIIREPLKHGLSFTWARKPMEYLWSFLGFMDKVPSTNLWVIPRTSLRTSTDYANFLPDLRRAQIRPYINISSNVCLYFGNWHIRYSSWSSHTASL